MGGGVYLEKGNQIFSVGLIRYENSEDVQGKCVQPTEYLKSGRFLMVQETFASAEGNASPSPPPPPRKFSDLKALKRHFQHSQADSCVKKVPQIFRYFS